MVINSPCLTDKKELASPEQTVSGKDFSNPLIVDSLLKTIWFINAPCFCNKALAIPGQTATGKELSNPLMADSLPKTILSTKISKIDWLLSSEVLFEGRPIMSICSQAMNGGICYIKSMWNGYLRKGRKTKPKRQNRTRNGKAWKRQSQDKSPSLKKSTKVNPDKSKVKK
ncbi:hypothetical protein Tco_0766641 [Tanacetum coccineum]